MEERVSHDDAPKAAPTDRKVSVEITRIWVRGQVIRWALVCGTILGSVYLIMKGLKEILAGPSIADWVFMLALALVAPSGVITILVKSRTKYVRKTHRRIAKLEELVDTRRTSSDPDQKR